MPEERIEKNEKGKVGPPPTPIKREDIYKAVTSEQCRHHWQVIPESSREVVHIDNACKSDCESKLITHYLFYCTKCLELKERSLHRKGIPLNQHASFFEGAHLGVPFKMGKNKRLKEAYGAGLYPQINVKG